MDSKLIRMFEALTNEEGNTRYVERDIESVPPEALAQVTLILSLAAWLLVERVPVEDVFARLVEGLGSSPPPYIWPMFRDHLYPQALRVADTLRKEIEERAPDAPETNQTVEDRMQEIFFGQNADMN